MVQTKGLKGGNNMNFQKQISKWINILSKIIVLSSMLTFSYGCVAWVKSTIDFPETTQQAIKKGKKIIEINYIKIEMENDICKRLRLTEFGSNSELLFSTIFGIPNYVRLSLGDKNYKFKVYDKHSSIQYFEIPSKTIYYQLFAIPLIGVPFADDYAPHYCDKADKDILDVAFSIYYNKLSLQGKYLYWIDVTRFYNEEVKSLLLSKPSMTIRAINEIGNSELQRCLSETLQNDPNFMLSNMYTIKNEFNYSNVSEVNNYYNNEVLQAYVSARSLINKQNPLTIGLFTPMEIEYCNNISKICKIYINDKEVFIISDDKKTIIPWDRPFYLHQYNKNNTNEDYLKYFHEYPGSFLKEKSLLEWAKRENTEEAYLTFLKNASQDEYLKKAKELYDPVMYQLAVSNEYSLTRVDSYIERYPDGKFIKQAKKHRERVYYNLAVKSNDLASCDQYISLFPNGKYRGKVTHLIENIEYNDAVKSDSLSKYDRFLKQFPKSKYVRKVKSLRKKLYLRLEKEAFDKAVRSDTLYSYQQFIDNYPKGKYTKKARSLYQKEYDRIERNYAITYNSAISYSGKDIVSLTYRTKSYKKAFEVISEVREAMRVQDPMGFFNPYWVTSCPEYGAKGYKGIVIGEWYTYGYQGFSNWKAMLKKEMSKIYSISSYNVNRGSSSYSSGSSSGKSSYSCYMKDSFYSSDSKCGRCSNNSESVCCVTRSGATSCTGPRGSFSSIHYEEALEKACGCY